MFTGDSSVLSRGALYLVDPRQMGNSHSVPSRTGRCVPATELEHGPADHRSHNLVWQNFGT